MKNQHLTTSQGSPVGDNQNSLTAGEFGPVLIQDVHLLEKLAHFNRERVPERVVPVSYTHLTLPTNSRV